MCSLRLVPKENHRILESYQDFILSRQAALLSPRTIEFYERTVGELISFLSERGIYEPEGITSGLIRGYFSSVSVRFTGSGFYSLHFGIIHWLEGNHRRIDLSGDIHFPFPTGHILFINRPISLNIKQPCGAA